MKFTTTEKAEKVPQTLQYLSKAQTTPRKRSTCLCLRKSFDEQAKSIGIKYENDSRELHIYSDIVCIFTSENNQ
jgi:hypothetical protein